MSNISAIAAGIAFVTLAATNVVAMLEGSRRGNEAGCRPTADSQERFL
jgi:hypothetical protein